MRVLVVGGTAFIGRETVHKLLRQGTTSRFVSAARSRSRAGGAQRPGGSRRPARAVRDARPGVMFDFAYDWQTRTPPAHVAAVARACGHPLERYIFMSSIAAYPPEPNHCEWAGRPDDMPNPLEPSNSQPPTPTGSKFAAIEPIWKLESGVEFRRLEVGSC